jgi:CheY-like chemotaxis protein
MLRVLYVDDEPDIREIVSIALPLDPEMTVETASSGLAAYARLRRGGIDLVLLDVMMPEKDGLATLKLLKSDAATRHLPVIMVTARTQQYELKQYVSQGAVGVISKPFDPMSLAREVRSIAARAAA